LVNVNSSVVGALNSKNPGLLPAVRQCLGDQIEVTQCSPDLGARENRYAVITHHDALVGMPVEPAIRRRVVRGEVAVADDELTEAGFKRHFGEEVGAKLADFVVKQDILQAAPINLVHGRIPMRYACVEKLQGCGGALRHQRETKSVDISQGSHERSSVSRRFRW